MVMPQLSHANEQFYPHGLKSISQGTVYQTRLSTPQLTAIGLLALLSTANLHCHVVQACNAWNVALVMLGVGSEMRELQLT